MYTPSLCTPIWAEIFISYLCYILLISFVFQWCLQGDQVPLSWSHERSIQEGHLIVQLLKFETVFFFCADGFAHLVHVHVWRSRLVGRDQASAGYRCRLRSSFCPFHHLYDDCRPQRHHRYLRQRRCGAGADGRGLEGADGVEGVPVPDRQA